MNWKEELRMDKKYGEKLKYEKKIKLYTENKKNKVWI